MLKARRRQALSVPTDAAKACSAGSSPTSQVEEAADQQEATGLACRPAARRRDLQAPGTGAARFSTGVFLLAGGPAPRPRPGLDCMSGLEASWQVPAHPRS